MKKLLNSIGCTNQYVIYVNDYLVLTDQKIYVDVKNQKQIIDIDGLVEIIPVKNTLNYNNQYEAYIHTKDRIYLMEKINFFNSINEISLINFCLCEIEIINSGKINVKRFFSRSQTSTGDLFVFCDKTKKYSETTKKGKSKTVCKCCGEDIYKFSHYLIVSVDNISQKHNDVNNFIIKNLRSSLLSIK